MKNSVLKISQKLTQIVDEIVAHLFGGIDAEGYIDIENIQDSVEAQLMRHNFYSVARRYIVYREEHRKARILRGQASPSKKADAELLISRTDGTFAPLRWDDISAELQNACEGLENCDAEPLFNEVNSYVFDRITEEELDRAKILAARTRIEIEPDYSIVAARLLLNLAYKHVFGYSISQSEDLETIYKEHFTKYLDEAIKAGLVHKSLKAFDLEKISNALKPERDGSFLYMGLQTIFDRYLLHKSDRRIEAPQYFWMRVSMGLAANEPKDQDEKAIEFYNILSTFRFVSSTPTLFNSGTKHPQLSSCYLSTTGDSLDHIFKVIADNAKLSKWAGGLGNDWTNVRATGSHIKGTNGRSQGVVPFLKVVNDTAVAVNQGGKRKGAVCAYLESWHLEVEEFQELRKNTGDERRRTHDMNTANWIPDLFIKRVLGNGTWTLFSPDDVPDLHDLYGRAFEARYLEYEKMVQDGRITNYKQLPALQLWRKMISMLFETGHPWFTFKDPSNIRSPQSPYGSCSQFKSLY